MARIRKLVTEKRIYNEMYNTLIAKLPYELLSNILDMTAFCNHNKLQYELNKEIIRYYVDNYFGYEFYAHYVYDENDDLLLIELNYNI